MKSKILLGSAALVSAGAIAWAAKDPVVMTVNGEDVPKSEFEYLYHKNSQQQVEAQPLDEYVGMFELYKMKVADAKAEGIDTTAAFVSEMAQYRHDLAVPYMADSVYLNNLVDEAYNRSLEEVDYYHIMVAKGRNAAEHAANLHKIDSIRTALLNGADFAEMARANSMDRGAATNGGHMGYIASGKLPYNFETAAYALTPGEISEVVESNAGYHVMKVGQRRPSKGSVQAAHIMKMVRPGASAEDEEKAKAAIDSIYALVSANPGEFSKIALENSDDPGSARMGGMVGWFSSGDMVPEFAETAFDMEVGDISQPVRSAYGWHIIKKLNAKGPRGKAELKPELLNRFNDPRDDRYKMVRANRDKKLAKKHKASVNPKVRDAMKSHVAAHGVDSAFYATFGTSSEPIFVINKKNVPASAFVATFNETINPDPYIGSLIFSDKMDAAYDDKLVRVEEDWLYANNDDYRNLLNEYRDGSLLYEVSLRKVWDKAANDTPGLEKYFADHRGEYTFKEPRVKGYLVLAQDSTVAEKMKARFPEIAKDSVLQTLRDEFKKVAIVDRLLAPKGINRFVDYEFFGGAVPEPNAKYPVYFILDGRIITEPEEMTDVKGAVTSDYQQLLEQNWTTELRQRYPVTRNEKELNKIK